MPLINCLPEYRLEQLCHLVLRFVPHGGATVDGRDDNFLVDIRFNVDSGALLRVILLLDLLTFCILQDEVDDAAIVVLHLRISTTPVE